MKRWWWDILNCRTPSFSEREREEGGGSGRRCALPVMLAAAQKCPKLSPVQEQSSTNVSWAEGKGGGEIRQGAGRSRSPRGGSHIFYLLASQ